MYGREYSRAELNYNLLHRDSSTIILSAIRSGLCQTNVYLALLIIYVITQHDAFIWGFNLYYVR